MTVSLLANAKINPTLRILGRRGDGYHELVTTMLALDLGDVVRVERVGGEVRLEIDGEFATPDVPLDASNLAARGAEAARTLAHSTAGLGLRVTKNVPSRAGLGGGSADAAAAVRATLIALGVETEGALGEELAALGSDCVFFDAARATGAALAAGRGERVTPIDAPLHWSVALVTPDVECSTPEVYAALDRTPGEVEAVDVDAEVANARALFALPATDARERLVNDLEVGARAASPELDRWFDLLAEVGQAHFRLAGSGSSLFGLFEDDAAAVAAIAAIESAARERGLGSRFSCVAHPAGSALTPAVEVGS